MSCEEFVELVTAYLDGALDPAAEARFTGYLASYPSCDRYLDQIRHTIDELSHLPADPLAGHARDRLLVVFRDLSEAWTRTTVHSGRS